MRDYIMTAARAVDKAADATAKCDCGGCKAVLRAAQVELQRRLRAQDAANKLAV
jgi:hypothetical protein